MTEKKIPGRQEIKIVPGKDGLIHIKQKSQYGSEQNVEIHVNDLETFIGLLETTFEEIEKTRKQQSKR